MGSHRIWKVTRSALLISIALPCIAQTLVAQTVEQPSRALTDPGVVTTRQAITPAGVPSIFQGRVYGVAWAGKSGDLWVLHSSNVYRLDWKNNRVVSRVSHGGVPGNQSIVAHPVSGGVIVGTSRRKARLVSVTEAGLQPLGGDLGSFQPGGLSMTDRVVAVPLVYENKLAVVDADSGGVLKQIGVGIAPFAAAIDRKGAVAYVSNLGGRPPKPNELYASPRLKADEKIVVDSRGIASTGSVTRVDITSGEVTATIAVGLHPTALAWDEPRQRLYVANGNSDSVSVVNTESNQVVQTIPLKPFSESVRGIAPTALQVSADGKTLFVACGGINAVVVLDVARGEDSRE